MFLQKIEFYVMKKLCFILQLFETLEQVIKVTEKKQRERT